MCTLFAGIIACANLPVVDSLAQSYPVKPIRILVGFSAGSGTDVTTRMVAQKLSEDLGQPVVVENRPAAAGTIAGQAVARSPADGYTLIMISSSNAVLPALLAKPPYDLKRDFAPVSLVAKTSLVVVVHPSVPARDVKELIALARSRPGILNYGSSAGGTAHFAGELLKSMAKVNIVHVPYKGAPAAVTATASGEVDMSFASIPATIPLLGAGKLRALAVTSAERTPLMPSLPAMAESGLPGYDRSVWYGMLAPAGVPKYVIARLNAEINKVVNTPEMKEAFNKQGLETQASTPEQFATYMHREIEQNIKLVKLIGLKAQ
ncbi:MAG: tripartite tricarboxylate transporter substrate binding protein [Betaproteobacteria bacterium]|nr:tripartite tricarboxylate transporter substrate binding protein [Betaproteobacteria bacterium]